MPRDPLVRRRQHRKEFMTTPEKITCKDVSILISQAQDRPLTPADQLRLQAHLALCKACESFQRQMRFLRQALSRHPARHGEEDDHSP